MDEEEYRELFPKSKALIVLETVCKAAVWLVIAFILGFSSSGCGRWAERR